VGFVGALGGVLVAVAVERARGGDQLARPRPGPPPALRAEADRLALDAAGERAHGDVDLAGGERLGDAVRGQPGFPGEPQGDVHYRVARQAVLLGDDDVGEVAAPGRAQQRLEADAAEVLAVALLQPDMGGVEGEALRRGVLAAEALLLGERPVEFLARVADAAVDRCLALRHQAQRGRGAGLGGHASLLLGDGSGPSSGSIGRSAPATPARAACSRARASSSARVAPSGAGWVAAARASVSRTRAAARAGGTPWRTARPTSRHSPMASPS